jgi:phage terminase large subunit
MSVEIPETMSFLFRPKRYKVGFGGRGGYKTESFGRALAIMAAERPLNILCAREIQKSIDASVHSMMRRLIRDLGLLNYYQIYDTRIKGIAGTMINYSGLFRNVENLKSTDEIDIIWVEEAHAVSDNSWQTLIPTIRKPGSEIWVSFNPKDEFSFAWKELVKPYLAEVRTNGFHEDATRYVVKTSLDENPFASDELRAESATMKKKNLKLWMHIYGGEVYSDYKQSIIQPEWIEASFDAHKKLVGWKPRGVKSCGFDPADTGDAKAAFHRHGSIVTKGYRWDDGEIPEAIDRAFDQCYESRDEYMVYDSDGLGAAMKVHLDKTTIQKGIEVVPYRGNDSPDNPDDYYYEDLHDSSRNKTNKEFFKNKRAQRYRLLADRFEATYNAVEKNIFTDTDDMISIDTEGVFDTDVLKAELLYIEKKMTDSSFYQLKSKKQMRKEGKKSPNMADALAMCFSNPAPDFESEEFDDMVFDSEW